MNIADQLEKHAGQELQHALTISRPIDYLGKIPTVSPELVKTSDNPKQILRFDLENENETVQRHLLLCRASIFGRSRICSWSYQGTSAVNRSSRTAEKCNSNAHLCAAKN